MPGSVLGEKGAMVHETDTVLPWGTHGAVDMQRKPDPESS